MQRHTDNLPFLLIIVGLIIAGSDGTWFPWINIIGTIIGIAGAAILQHNL